MEQCERSSSVTLLSEEAMYCTCERSQLLGEGWGVLGAQRNVLEY